MGDLLTIKSCFFFNDLMPSRRRQLKGATLLVLRRVNDFLSKPMTGNKSGAPKLTLSGKRIGAETNRLPSSAGRSAVRSRHAPNSSPRKALALIWGRQISDLVH
jgi:hypothetical protein